MSKMSMTLRIIVYRESRLWLAHCLEMDIVAEGKAPAAAVKDLLDLCFLQINVAGEEGDLESIFRPAPPAIWKMFFTSQKKRMVKPPRGAPIEAIEERELSLV